MFTDILKKTTALSHQQLESQFDLNSLVNSPERLEEYLLKLHSVVVPVEEELLRFRDQLAEKGIDLGSRLKTAILEEDLARLDTAMIPEALEFDGISSVYEALGVLYVLEGSTLGGQVISKALKKNNLEANYFDPYGPRMMTFWNELKASLNEVPASHEEEVLTGALKTFDIFKDYIHTGPLN